LILKTIEADFIHAALWTRINITCIHFCT